MGAMQNPERLRSTAGLRDLLTENRVHSSDLVLPLFLNQTKSFDIQSMPGVRQWQVADSLRFVSEARELGVKSFILFGIVGHKSPQGEAAWDPSGPVPQALALYRKELGADVNLFADTCYCEYTSHGHCGPMDTETELRHSEATLTGLAKMAQCYAEAGANIIAPSGMVDGMVKNIRAALEAKKFSRVAICSYAVKYASSFYGPFREAAENAPQFGDRKSYQMDGANAREAMREARLDIAEGADMLLVKPGLPYLDILQRVSADSPVPVGAYHVSGEYSMVKAAAEKGWVDESKVFMESLLAFKRAGAKFVLSYWAVEAARLLRNG